MASDSYFSIDLMVDDVISLSSNTAERAKILTIDGINVGQEQFDLPPNQVIAHTFNTILNSFGKHKIKLEVIYDEYSGDNTYLLGLDIPDNINIGILGEDSKNYEFITNSLMAFKEKFQIRDRPPEKN